MTLRSIKFFNILENFWGFFTFFKPLTPAFGADSFRNVIPLTPASDAYSFRNIIIYFFEISFTFIVKTMVFLSQKFFASNVKFASNSSLCFCSSFAPILENRIVIFRIWYLRNFHFIWGWLETSLLFFIFLMHYFKFSCQMFSDSNELLNFQNP